ncbi:hypothetical protein HAX54_024250, partial [Datura stramonium]|nr:hypothetical protein [Datura stramonium]
MRSWIESRSPTREILVVVPNQERSKSPRFQRFAEESKQKRWLWPGHMQVLHRHDSFEVCLCVKLHSDLVGNGAIVVVPRVNTRGYNMRPAVLSHMDDNNSDTVCDELVLNLDKEKQKRKKHIVE